MRVEPSELMHVCRWGLLKPIVGLRKAVHDCEGNLVILQVIELSEKEFYSTGVLCWLLLCYAFVWTTDMVVSQEQTCQMRTS